MPICPSVLSGPQARTSWRSTDYVEKCTSCPWVYSWNDDEAPKVIDGKCDECRGAA